MADFDPSAPPTYNSMQQQMGLMPPAMQPSPVIFPGQVSAAVVQGGPGAAFAMMGGGMMGGGMMGGPMMGGPMMGRYDMPMGAYQSPMQGLSAFAPPPFSPAIFSPPPPMMASPMPTANPYAGLAARGPAYGPPGLFTPSAPYAPPVYAGQAAPGFGAPQLPPPMFNTGFDAGIERHQLGEDAAYTHGLGAAGIGARIGTNLVGAAAGAHLARGFGTPGRVVGGIAGFLGSEMFGAGRAGQNLFMGNVATPLLHQRAATAGIEEMSQRFVNMGPELNIRGGGFSHHGAASVASQIRDMASSGSFQRETGNRFNQQDLLKITQEAGRADMMTGVQSSSQMVGRVRDIAKSLSSFMELAQEPDIQRAIQTMGQLRTSGLNLSETMQAVSNGRSFARMAGTTFGEISSQAGAMGGATYQGVGLSQGLGIQSGMMNYATARASQNAGAFTPQMMSMLGGAQGYAAMNTAFGANMLQMPMLAPSVMSSAGGINAGALQNLISGRVDPFRQTSNAASALSGITGRQGVEGLGMAIAMQPMVQDTIGRRLQAEGPFAQRNFEDKNIMNMMRQMGMTGSAGYATAAQAMGMAPGAAAARAQEMASPVFFAQQRRQIETQHMEERERELADQEENKPSLLNTIARQTDLKDFGGRLSRDLGRAFRSSFHVTHSHYEPETAAGARRLARLTSGDEFSRYSHEVANEAARRGDRETTARDEIDVARGEGFTGVGAYLAAGLGVGSGNYAGRTGGTRARLDDLTGGGRLLGLANSSSVREHDTASARMQRTFGQEDAAAIQSAMAQGIAGRLDRGPGGMGATSRGIYNLMGNVAGAPGGLVGSRQLTQSDIRTEFVRAATQGGRMSRERAEEYFQQNSGEVMQAISPQLQGILTPEQRAALQDQSNRLTGAGGNRGNIGQVVQERTDRTLNQLFGTKDPRVQDQFLRTMENIRGQGREGSQQMDASKQYVFATAALRSQIQRVGADSEEGRRLVRQMDQVGAEARRRGVDVNGALQNQANALANRMGEGDMGDMARNFVQTGGGKTGAQLLGGLATGEQALLFGRQNQREREGFAALATGGGVLAQRLQAAGLTDASTMDRAKVREVIQGLSRDEIASLPEDQRRRIEAIASGSRAGERELGALGRDYGERAATLRRRYETEHGDTYRAIANSSIGRFFGGGVDRYVKENIGRTTNADARADQAIQNTNQAEAAANRAGIGGANDPMTQAASELRVAAQALQSVVQGGALDRTVSGE